MVMVMSDETMFALLLLLSMQIRRNRHVMYNKIEYVCKVPQTLIRLGMKKKIFDYDGKGHEKVLLQVCRRHF